MKVISELAKQMAPSRQGYDKGTVLYIDLCDLIFECRNCTYADDKMRVQDFKNRCMHCINKIAEYSDKAIRNDRFIAQLADSSLEANISLGEQLTRADALLYDARRWYKKHRSPKVLCGSINYFNNKVYYEGELVSSPRANSKERAVWKLLSESTDVPRTASFAKMREEKDGRGNLLFPNLGDSITSDLAKWNSKFAKFDIIPLHKDGDSIQLRDEKK